jgi:hypothetical protein
MIQATQEVFRQTLANCAAFQSLVGADDATEALERIYHDQLPKPESGKPEHSKAELTTLRPCAIVYTAMGPGGWISQRDAMGDDCWHNSGIIVCVIMRNVPEEDKEFLSLVDTEFRTIAGNILVQLIELSETEENLTCDRIEAMGPYRTDPKELSAVGDAQSFELVVHWGAR